MGRRRDLAVIRNLTDLPKPFDRAGAVGNLADLGIATGMFEYQHVLGDGSPRQPGLDRIGGERGLQGSQRGKIQVRVAPLQHFDRLEPMTLQRPDQFRLERRTTAGGTEGSVARCASGASGDLREFRRIEPPELIAVELAVGSKRDVVDIQVQPHADGIGGDQIIDLAGLIELDLCVARARRKRAQHHRRAAALPADQLGDRVDFLGRERDDGRTPRQTCDLLLARVGEEREPRPAHDVGAGQQLFHDLPHGGGAQQESFLPAAPVQHPIREHMPALQIRAELNFVHRQKRDIEVARHGFQGGDPEPRICRLDLLLAGHQRDRLGAHGRNALVVDLARE